MMCFLRFCSWGVGWGSSDGGESDGSNLVGVSRNLNGDCDDGHYGQS